MFRKIMKDSFGLMRGQGRGSAAILLASALALGLLAAGCIDEEPVDTAPIAIEAVEPSPVAKAPAGAPPVGPPGANNPANRGNQEASAQPTGVTLTPEQLADLRRSVRRLDEDAAQKTAEAAAAAAEAAGEQRHFHAPDAPCGCAAGRAGSFAPPTNAHTDLQGHWRIMELAMDTPGESRRPPVGSYIFFRENNYSLFIPGNEPARFPYSVGRMGDSELVATFPGIEGEVNVSLDGRQSARLTDDEDRVLMTLVR